LGRFVEHEIGFSALDRLASDWMKACNTVAGVQILHTSESVGLNLLNTDWKIIAGFRGCL